MALILTEGFDWTNNLDTLRARDWSSTFATTGYCGIDWEGGRSSQVWRGNNGSLISAQYAIRELPTAFGSGDTIIIGGAFKINSFGECKVCLFTNQHSNSIGGVSVWVQDDGTFYVASTSPYNVGTFSSWSTLHCSGTTTDPILNTWFYVELKVEVNSTGGAGSVSLRVNGSPVCNNAACTTLDASYPSINSIRYFGGYLRNIGSGYPSPVYMDDLYVADGTGTYNNDFLGEISIKTLRPDSDDGTNTWTPSTGSAHYAVLDESNYSSTDYLTSTTNNGDREVFGMTDLDDTVGSILAVVPVVAAMKDDAGTRNVKLAAISGSSEELSAAHPLSYGTVSLPALFCEVNPDTTAPWTISEVNSMKIALEVA
jgi:hypothetical protein